MPMEAIELSQRADSHSADGNRASWYRFETQIPGHIEALSSIDGLDAVTIAALTAEDTRPRCLAHGTGALLILRGVNAAPGADPEDMVSFRMWIDHERVVTFQLRHLEVVDDMASDLAHGRGPSTTGEFVVVLVDRLTDRMQEIVDSVDTTLDDLEDGETSKPATLLRQEIAKIRRKIVLLRRFIAPQRDALDVLIAEDFEWQTELQDRRLKDIVDRITRLVEQLDAMQHRAAILQDLVSVRVSEHLNRTMVLLSIVAGVFLPLSFVVGLFGMNVAGIPWSTNPASFFAITFGLLVVGLGTLVLLLKLWPK